MPLHLDGACQCGAIRFGVDSQAPAPYQLCYCSICRKSAGAGGYAINLSALAETLVLHDPKGAKRSMHAVLHDGGKARRSAAERHFCGACGSPLWLYDARWPALLHPHASAIDTPLPVPPHRVHIMLGSKAGWAVPQVAPGDECFDGYPDRSIEAWHKAHGLWVA